ncbi:MAG TPA: tetratricopeptide repeat protein [Pyrinomonadaceae bacterium]|nr:tetratricopeptide repeat protein [Pyrinomonadaceae bacterium]
MNNFIRASSFALLIVALQFAAPDILAQDDDEPTEDPVAIFNQAQDLHEKGDLAGAIKLYDKAISLTEAFPEAEYQKGTAYLALNNIVEAESAFRKAIEQKKDWSLALAMLGETLVRKFLSITPSDGNNGSEIEKEANAVLRHAIEIDANNFPAYSALADLQINGRATKATLTDTLSKIRIVTDGKMKLPSSIWSARAALENALGERKAARSSIKNALADTRNHSALRLAAELALADNDIEQARSFAETLAKVAADDPQTFLTRAKLAAAEGKFDEAAFMLDQIKAPMRNADSLRASVNAIRKRGKAEFEKMIADDPNNATALGGLCKMYRIEAPEKALEYCRRASEVEPNNIDHAIGYGGALVQAKRHDLAVVILSKLKVLAPDNSTIRVNFATSLYQLKRFAEARDEYRWIVDKYPDRAIGYFLLAVTHDQLAEYIDAMANYQKFIKLADPSKNQLEIDKVQLRLPSLEKQVKEMKRK